MNPRKTPDEQRATAIAAYLEGATVRAAAALIGVSDTALRKWLKAANIPLRRTNVRRGPRMTLIQAEVTVEQRWIFDLWRGDRTVAQVLREWIDSMPIPAELFYGPIQEPRCNCYTRHEDGRHSGKACSTYVRTNVCPMYPTFGGVRYPAVRGNG